MKTLEEVSKTLNELVKIVEDMNQNEKSWPQKGDNYLFEDSAGEILVEMFYPESHVDKYRLLTGNCYRTKRDLINEQNRKVLKGKILQMLKEKNGDWIPDWGGDPVKWYLFWDHIREHADIAQTRVHQITAYSAKSKEIWQQIIDKFGEREVAEALGIIE